MDETVTGLKKKIEGLEIKVEGLDKKIETLEAALKEQQRNIQLCYETLDLLTQRYASDREEISKKFIDVENVISLSLAMMQKSETLITNLVPVAEQLNKRVAELENKH